MNRESIITDEKLWALSKELLSSGTDAGQEKSAARENTGLKDQLVELIDLLRGAMWPQIFSIGHLYREPSAVVVSNRLERAAILLVSIMKSVQPERTDCEERAMEFLGELPSIKEILATDVQAAYEGDPAAKGHQEIMLAYPAFEAISIFRLAHKLYEMQIPLLPRMMTEHAHSLTGIDINPGATIGRYFFIDHGTGVVVGETTVIGDRVKLYQGVTLGAKSFALDENGNPVKGLKRHPNIGNNVVIYAGATILGGTTYIGDNCVIGAGSTIMGEDVYIGEGCVIGGNIWLTHSVAAGSRILAAQERPDLS